MAGEVYDVAIVGSGAAGQAAAVQAAWAGLRTLVLGGFEAGGRLLFSRRLENYPGFAEGVGGWQLADALEEQAVRLGAQMRPEDVVRVGLLGRPFRLWAEGEDGPALARAVIVATGAKPRWLGARGEQRFVGRGVSGCASCDGFFFRDRRVAVVGGGDTAMEALLLTEYAREVVVVHRRERFRASGTLLGRARSDPKITFLTETVVEEVLGGYSVEGLRTRDVDTGEEDVLVVDGVFVAVGTGPPSLGPFSGLLETDGEGYVVRKGGTTATSVAGVFAAGDVADGRYRQTATAVGEGCKAAVDARRWLEERGEAGGTG